MSVINKKVNLKHGNIQSRTFGSYKTKQTNVTHSSLHKNYQ